MEFKATCVIDNMIPMLKRLGLIRDELEIFNRYSEWSLKNGWRLQI
jgi:hypothetical protein